jgi:hypothetical protein
MKIPFVFQFKMRIMEIEWEKIYRDKRKTHTKVRIICHNHFKKCVAYPQEDFLFIKLITSLRISLLNNCKKDFQFHTESKFLYTEYKIFLHEPNFSGRQTADGR